MARRAARLAVRKVGLTAAAAVCGWLAAGAAAAAPAVWQDIGPSGGSVAALAVDPRTATTAYAAAGGAGLFKTIDGGRSWAHSDAGLLQLLPQSIDTVAVDPRVPGRVFAGTGRGLFTSGDGGATWAPPSQPVSGAVTCIVFAPRAPRTLYVCEGFRLRRSSDGGATWVRVPRAPFLEQLAIDPFQPNTLYAGTQGGAWKSTDGGVTWRSASQGMGSPAPEVLAITADPQHQGRLYAGVLEAAFGQQGLYMSRDGGATWKPVLAPPAPGVSCVVISPAAGRPLYACASGLFRSLDGGATWQALGGGLNGTPIGALAVAPSAPDVLYAGVGGFAQVPASPAVYRSADAGAVWQPAGAGITALPVTALAADPVQPGTVYLGTEGQGLLETTDGGAGWAPAGTGLHGAEVLAVAVAPSSPATLYAETNRALWVSHDSGAQWVHPGARILLAPPLVVDPQTPTTLYSILGASPARSLDGGATWSALTTFEAQYFTALAVAPSDPSTIYFAATFIVEGLNTVVLVSRDGGATFQEIPFGFNTVTAIAVDPADADTVYISGNSGSGVGGVWMSHDGGQTLGQLFGVSELNVLLVDPANPAALYGAVTYAPAGQVVVSRDGGATWSVLAPGLPGARVTQLALGGGGILYAGTDGAGVYQVAADAD